MKSIADNAFEAYLDRTWPLHRDPKNYGGVKWNQLRSAFMAGVKFAEQGPTAKELGIELGKPLSLLDVAIFKRGRFKPKAKKRGT